MNHTKLEDMDLSVLRFSKDLTPPGKGSIIKRCQKDKYIYCEEDPELSLAELILMSKDIEVLVTLLMIFTILVIGLCSCTSGVLPSLGQSILAIATTSFS